MTRGGSLLLLALLLALVGAGCGAGGDDGPQGVTLTVSRDFGSVRLGQAREDRVTEGETVMRLLQRRFDVATRYGGGFVQTVEGVAGGRRGGRPVDWFYYVNGIESSVGAAERRLFAGDRVWWDHHDWGATMDVPAVVGSFPEPFLSGTVGRKIPMRLDCARDAERACDEVAERLTIAGVRTFGRSTIGQTQGRDSLRIVVGRWADVRRDRAASRIDAGPRRSGVYARFDASGRSLAILDARGREVRRLGAGSGLVAATRAGAQAPTWVVTGTDGVGVAAAAAALDDELLGNRFALALEAGRGVPLPVNTGAP